MVLGFKKQFVEPILKGSKVHTLRECDIYRWRVGVIIHMATGIRTKYYQCFKETPFVSSQQVFMTYYDDLVISVDEMRLSFDDVDIFIKNDGFESEEEFIKWFFPKGNGKSLLTLLHWTDLRY